MANTYNKVDFIQCTYDQYRRATVSRNTLYFCEDVGKIFKGAFDITTNFQSVSKEIYDALTEENTIPYTYYVCRENFKIKLTYVVNDVRTLQEIYPGYVTAEGESSSVEKALTTQSYVLQEINKAVISIVRNLDNQIDHLTDQNKVVVTDGEGSIANSGYSIGDGVIQETSQDASDKVLATEKAAKKAAEDAVSKWGSF